MAIILGPWRPERVRVTTDMRDATRPSGPRGIQSIELGYRILPSGYGGVFVQHWLPDHAKRILNIPRLWRFLGTFTFGHAAEEKRQTRLPFDEVVFIDRVPGEPRP